jgi:hypothetical protein
MKPPSNMPSKERVARKLALPVRADWQMATIDQRQICVGIQRSGPTYLLTSWDGNSAQAKETMKTIVPRLRSVLRSVSNGKRCGQPC